MLDKTNMRDIFLYLGQLALAAAAYVIALQALLLSYAGQIGGVAVMPGLQSLSAGSLQIAPFLGALFLIITAPIWTALARHVSKKAGVTDYSSLRSLFYSLLAHMVPAALITLVTVAVVAELANTHLDGIPASALALAALGLFVDLYLVALFTMALLGITRRRLLAFPLFIFYAILVMLIGSLLGITAYIGYGTTPPVELSSFTNIPIGYAAAWTHRLYWIALTLAGLLILIKYRYYRPNKALRSGLVFFGIALFCVTALVAGLQFDRPVLASLSGVPFLTADEPSGEPTSLRSRLTHYEVNLTFEPDRGTVQVRADITFSGGTSGDQIIWLKRPDAVDIEEFTVHGLDNSVVSANESWLRILPQAKNKPYKSFRISYRGTISSPKTSVMAVASRVLERSFFLTHSDLLFTPRPCMGMSRAICSSLETYQLADSATGVINVIAPGDLTVISGGNMTEVSLPTGQIKTTFNVNLPQLATFLIVCGEFRKIVPDEGKGGQSINLYLPTTLARSADFKHEIAIAQSAQASYDYFALNWSSLDNQDIKIVAVPNGITTALSFNGIIAIGEGLIGSRGTEPDNVATLLQFVIAHEMAHQWWGYRLVPTRNAGWLFVLESFAQFAAYSFLEDQDIMTRKAAIALEETRFQAIYDKDTGVETSLAQLAAGDDILAYTKGTVMLMQVDQWSDGRLLAIMGSVLDRCDCAANNPRNINILLNSFLAKIPEDVRNLTRELIYTVNPWQYNPLQSYLDVK